MKTASIVSIGIIAMFACLLFCTTASADYNFGGFPVETRTSGTVNGGVFVDYKPWAGTTTLTGNFDVPDGTIKWARLYTGIWGGNPTATGWVNVTFNGISNTIHLQGESDTNPNVWCTGCGKYWMWFDVTSQTKAGDTNTATTSKVSGSIDGRVYGIVLVVLYEGGDNPKNIQYWINDGSDALHHAYYPNPEKNEGTTDFAGTVDTGSVTKANLTMVHLTAYEPTCSNCLKFNNNPLDTSMITRNTIDLHSWDVESDIESSGNDAWFSRGEDPYVNICNAILVLEKEGENGEADLTVTEIAAYHYGTHGTPWFNLSNDVGVTVRNSGNASAGSFDVDLYADSEFIGKQTVPGLEPGKSTIVPFEWTPYPTGPDCLETIDNVCRFNWTHKWYNITAVVAGKNYTTMRKVCFDGYEANHPLENVAHGTLKGGLIFTTGDGEYKGLYNVGDTQVTHYDITLPEDATVKFANLNVYYTWSKSKAGIEVACAEMEVSITNQTGTYVVPLKKSYNDIKCQCAGVPWEYPWGNYVYNVADYIDGSGTYTVTVKNDCTEKCRYFCPAAPGIVLVYEDANAPMIEYWINEGADILIGGRRPDGGFLSLAECINNATFPGSTTGEIVTATLGVVSPWAGESWKPGTSNVLYFNDVELGRGVYQGYHKKYNKKIDGISMHIGSTNAQIGVNVTDVTSYLQASDNVVGQGDDGDNMMPSNAFLVITREAEEKIFDTGPSANPYPSIFGTHDGTITPTYDITVDTMYTYPCTGTGGHTEYIRIYDESGTIAEANWTGYVGDWHNITFAASFTLEHGKEYKYTIRTGSYPQILHAKSKDVTGGKITCSEFRDLRGNIYYDWIPAIKLYLV